MPPRSRSPVAAAPLPLARADLRQVGTVFTDVDGTLTSEGKLTSQVLLALERLQAAGVEVVLVSGRPAGWGETWLRQLPVAGVIVENGALALVPHGRRVRRIYSQPESARRRHRRRLLTLVRRAMQQVPGATLSTDSASREVDLAIDYAEEVSLGPAAARKLEGWLRARGCNAVRSSVHVNVWLGHFDKRTAVELYLAQVRRQRLGPALQRRLVYAGDSLNDAPLFAAFSLSVGVANVLDVLPQLDAPPKYVTRAREGQGFAELADAVLVARARGRR